MKLLYHPPCNDLFKLDYMPRTCRCGEAVGAYNADGDTAWHNGKGVVLCLSNYLLPLLVDGKLTEIALQKYVTRSSKVEVKEGEVMTQTEDFLKDIRRRLLGRIVKSRQILNEDVERVFDELSYTVAQLGRGRRRKGHEALVRRGNDTAGSPKAA